MSSPPVSPPVSPHHSSPPESPLPSPVALRERSPVRADARAHTRRAPWVNGGAKAPGGYDSRTFFDKETHVFWQLRWVGGTGTPCFYHVPFSPDDTEWVNNEDYVLRPM